MPLIMGAFFKFTLNLNNTTSTITAGAGANPTMVLATVSNPNGGVNPLMIASTQKH